MHPAVTNLCDELGISEAAFDGWQCTVAQRAGVDVAVVLSKGTELHMASLTDKKAISRKNVRDFVLPILLEYGFVTTRVPIAETDHKLRERLGFLKTWSDDHYSYFCMTEPPYEKAPQ